MTPSPPPPPAARGLLSLGLELAVSLGIFMYAGYKIDAWMDNQGPWFTTGGALLGLAVGFYGFVRRVLALRPPQ